MNDWMNGLLQLNGGALQRRRIDENAGVMDVLRSSSIGYKCSVWVEPLHEVYS